jgi:hypothetical protein
MLSPIIGTPHRYIHIGKAKRLPATVHQVDCFNYFLYRLFGGIGKLVTPNGACGLSDLLRCFRP